VRLKSGAIQAPLEIKCKVELDGPGGLTRVGIVRYIGHVHHKTGVFYGIELIDGSLGNNDGCVGEYRYFEMKAKTTRDGRRSPRRLVDKRGVFVRQFKIRRVMRGSREGSASPRKLTTSVDYPALSPHKKKQRIGDDKYSGKSSSRNTNSNVKSSSSKPNIVSNNGRRSKWSKRLCQICGEDLNINQPLGDRVLDHVLIGGFEQSQDLEGLTLSGVTHVLNCARELPNCFPETLKYLKFDCADDNKQKILPCFEKAFEFMDECYDEKGVCLVHCQQGKSRSAAVIAGYLMARRGLSLSAAIERMQAVRRIARPNDNFMAQLRTFERATKRWRRNPDPRTKRLYALQSFEQPRRKRYKEKKRRGSIGVTKQEKKQKTKTENNRESRRKRKSKSQKRKKSISKSPAPNRGNISNMWSLSSEETSKHPFILMDSKPEVKENLDPVLHSTNRGRKKQRSPRRTSRKVRTPTEKKLDKAKGKLKRSNKDQSIWGFVDDGCSKSSKKLASGLEFEFPPKLEVVDDGKDNEEVNSWFKPNVEPPQNLSPHTSHSLGETRPSLRAVPPSTPSNPKVAESPSNVSYRTSRLAKSRVERWSTPKQSMRNNFDGFSGSTIAVSQMV